MERAAFVGVWGLLWIGVAGCGPAPYAIEPDDAQPRPEPPIVVMTQPATVAVVVAPAPVAVAAPAPSPIVLATLRRYHHKFHKCYAKSLHRDRGLRGTTLVRVTLDPDGDVRSAQDWGGDLPDRKLRECIVDVYEDIEFPEPAGGQVFVHQLTFEPTRRGGVVR